MTTPDGRELNLRTIMAEMFEMPPEGQDEEENKQWWEDKSRNAYDMVSGNSFKTNEEMNIYCKTFTAWHPLTLLSQFLSKAEEPDKNTTPGILNLMWLGRDMLLPLIGQMKDKLVEELEAKGINAGPMRKDEKM